MVEHIPEMTKGEHDYWEEKCANLGNSALTPCYVKPRGIKMKSREEEYSELCEQMNQLSEAILGFREGRFEDMLRGINLLSADCVRLRKELDDANCVIR